MDHHTVHAAGTSSFWAASQALEARVTSTAAGYIMRLYAGFYAISILSSLWVYFVARKLPPGRWRGLACAPVVLLQMAATPVLVDRLRTPVLIVPVSGILSLAAFKVGLGHNSGAVTGLAYCTPWKAILPIASHSVGVQLS